MNAIKSLARKVYKNVLYITFIAVMTLCMVLFITFLANPAKMIETIKQVFGLN